MAQEDNWLPGFNFNVEEWHRSAEAHYLQSVTAADCYGGDNDDN
jgi:hypothetical protein